MKKALLAVALLATLGLTACSSDNSNVQILTHFRGVDRPQQTQSSSDFGPAVYWTSNSRATVGLTTYGSGSCPLYPAKMTVVSPTKVELTMKDYTGACTSDLTAYTSEFALPGTVSRSKDVKVVLNASHSTPTPLTLRPEPTLQGDKRFSAPAR